MREAYEATFRKAFMLGDEAEVKNFEYQVTKAWDSVGHLTLMTEIENTFGIELEVDDVIDFSSFTVGAEILKKYDITV